jgi:chemotaxis protein methyltransferase CheR
MAGRISEKLLSEFSEFISIHMGLFFPKERWIDLERGIYASAKEFNFTDIESYLYTLMLSPLKKSQIEILAGYLTVGETYFFREKNSFEILEEKILREIIEARKGKEQRIRIWSAGCCTGEETYSIAISLNKILPDMKGWNITIIGTDINPIFLQKSSEGIYSKWSFRNTPEKFQETYFIEKPDSRFEILSQIKKMVNFSYINLAEDVYPSLINNTNAMDIIFCRNVLMYFSPKLIDKVIRNLYNSLVEGGWLIVSGTEISHINFKYFTPFNIQGMTLYKKDSSSYQKDQSIYNFLKKDINPEIQQKTSLVIPEYNMDIPQDTNERLYFREKDNEIIKQEVETQNKNKIINTSESTETTGQILDKYTEIFSLVQQGSVPEAHKKATLLLLQNPKDSQAMMILSKIFANQGELDKALKWCEKAINYDKLNPECYYLRAEILQEKGIIDEAVKSLKQTLFLDQNFVLAHFALGNLAKQHLISEESNKYFENILSFLKNVPKNEILPGSDGITNGRFLEIVNSIILKEK